MRSSPRKLKIVISIAIVMASLPLLFHGLGNYALWDDEALVALSAKGVWRTGDTTAFIDRNIVAYRSGILLKNGHDRSTPPLPAYIVAPLIGMVSEAAGVVRFPFALFGCLTIILIVFWLWNDDAGLALWYLMGIAIIGNVSLFLFFRQCRYYSPAIFFTVATAYLYIHIKESWRQTILLSVALLFLLLSNYMNYAALVICLVFDYLAWGRKKHPLQYGHLVFIILSQFIVMILVISIWNPLDTGNAEAFKSNTWMDRITLIWFNLRDINRCEFMPGLLLLLLPIVVWFKRDLWLSRGMVALMIYVVSISVFSPQLLQGALRADVRYLSPLILLGMFLTVLILYRLFERKLWLAVALAPFVFWTNILNEACLGYAGLRSTIIAYAAELVAPLPEPYTPTAEWINRNVAENQSIWVVPDFKNYPLMYHAPRALYAWQLTDPPPKEYRGLPPIHFRGRVAPDYIIAFGPLVKTLPLMLKEKDVYVLAALLPYYWRDAYRPELFWHAFKAITYDKNGLEEIYIFRRKTD